VSSAASPLAVMRAVRLINLGRPQEAELILRAVLAEGFTDVAVFALLSTCLRRQRRWEEAVEAARSAVAEGPTDARGFVELAHALRGLGKDAEALDAGREAARLDPHSAASLHALAETAKDLSLPEAEQAAIRYQELAPHSAAAHSLRGSIEITRKRWPEAERWIRESLRCDPLNAATHANLALVLDLQGRRDEARAEHQEAVRLDPQREVPRQNLHQSLRLDRVKGSAGGAPFDADLVGSTLAPSSLAKSLINVIMQAIREGRLDEARASAREARALLESLATEDLEDRRARIRLTAAIARAEFNEEPAREVAVAAEQLPEAREVLRSSELLVFLNNLGAAQLRAGDPHAAQTMAEVLEMTRPSGNANNIGMALLNLGAAYSAAGDDAAAEPCYVEGLELALANGHTARAARVEVNLAQMRLRHQEIDRAARHAERAVELAARSDEPMLVAKVRVTAAGVELRRGRLVEARRSLLTALQALRRGGDAGESYGYAYLAELAAHAGRSRVAELHLRRAERRARSPVARETVAGSRAAVQALLSSRT
jgi:tetratricopeptide (TPR) repeat protein